MLRETGRGAQRHSSRLLDALLCGLDDHRECEPEGAYALALREEQLVAQRALIEIRVGQTHLRIAEVTRKPHHGVARDADEAILCELACLAVRHEDRSIRHFSRAVGMLGDDLVGGRLREMVGAITLCRDIASERCGCFDSTTRD